jgi:hypothetical protein
MARAHTAGKEKHGNMAAGLASFACLFFFLFRNSCGGKKRNSYSRNFAQTQLDNKQNQNLALKFVLYQNTRVRVIGISKINITLAARCHSNDNDNDPRCRIYSDADAGLCYMTTQNPVYGNVRFVFFQSP